LDAELPGSYLVPLYGKYESIEETLAELPVWEVEKRNQMSTMLTRIGITARRKSSDSRAIGSVMTIISAVFESIIEQV
jgi:hypothetical protein